jgi:hypothetical protein
VNVAAGEELNEKVSARPLGHANLNDLRVARTRSLKRTASTPDAEIDAELTRGALSAEADHGTRSVSHEVPADADTPPASSNGDASATATTRRQLVSRRPPSPTTRPD